MLNFNPIYSFSSITVNLTYSWIVILKGAAGALGLPGPEGTEGPKVSVVTKYACFTKYAVDNQFGPQRNHELMTCMLTILKLANHSQHVSFCLA